MKKFTSLVLALFILSVGGVFSQENPVRFAIEGFISTDFESIMPAIGINVQLQKIDIFTGIGVNIFSGKEDLRTQGWWNPDEGEWNGSNISVYVGVAPKTTVERITLSLPILFNATLYKQDKNFDNYDFHFVEKSNFFSFLTGGRIDYNLNKHLSFFTGFLINIFQFTTLDYNSTGRDSDNIVRLLDNHREYTTWFSGGKFLLGISYKI